MKSLTVVFIFWSATTSFAQAQLNCQSAWVYQANQFSDPSQIKDTKTEPLYWREPLKPDDLNRNNLMATFCHARVQEFNNNPKNISEGRQAVLLDKTPSEDRVQGNRGNPRDARYFYFCNAIVSTYNVGPWVLSRTQQPAANAGKNVQCISCDNSELGDRPIEETVSCLRTSVTSIVNGAYPVTEADVKAILSKYQTVTMFKPSNLSTPNEVTPFARFFAWVRQNYPNVQM